MDSRATILLKQFVEARDRGDEATQYARWSDLMTYAWPHAKAQIAVHRAVWNQDERDDALSETGRRLTMRVWKNFNGTTMREFIGAVKTTAKIACLDVQRDVAEYNERTEWLEAPVKGEEGTIGTRADSVFLDQELKRLADEEADALMLAALKEAREFLDWALPQLIEKRRTVIELLLEGLTPPAIMERLDISRADVDTTKSRALKDLTKLLEQYRKEQNS